MVRSNVWVKLMCVETSSVIFADCSTVLSPNNLQNSNTYINHMPISWNT